MTKKLEPLVFFGTEDFSAEILQGLIDAQFSIEAVITKPDFKKGRGRKLQPPAVKTVAEQHRIPVFALTNRQSIMEAVQQTSAQTGTLASFGKIIPPEAIKAFSNGIINVHPSLLPKYRGPSPIETAILNGDPATGVSIMELVDEVDAGDIYSQVVVKLSGRETKAELYQRLAKTSTDLLIKTLNQIKTGLKPTPQNHDQASFTKLFLKTDGLLQPDKHTAAELERQIRAFQGFPKSFTFINNQRIIILEATADAKIKSPIHFVCQDQSILNIQSLITPNGKTTSAEAFKRGLKTS